MVRGNGRGNWIDRGSCGMHIRSSNPWNGPIPVTRPNTIVPWYAAPVSSWDALDTLKTLYGPKSSSAYAYGWIVAGHTLLFLPLLITFHLMERETKTFQSFTWSDYNEYREGLPNLLSSGIAYRERLRLQIRERIFSYGNVVGHYAEGADRYETDDKLFAAKVLGPYFSQDAGTGSGPERDYRFHGTT